MHASGRSFTIVHYLERQIFPGRYGKRENGTVVRQRNSSQTDSGTAVRQISRERSSGCFEPTIMNSRFIRTPTILALYLIQLLLHDTSVSHAPNSFSPISSSFGYRRKFFSVKGFKILAIAKRCRTKD